MRGAKKRALLKIGDHVAVLGCGRVVIATVTKVEPERVSVALTPKWIAEYQIKDGLEVEEFPGTRLRGPATRKEVEALQKLIMPWAELDQKTVILAAVLFL